MEVACRESAAVQAGPWKMPCKQEKSDQITAMPFFKLTFIRIIFKHTQNYNNGIMNPQISIIQMQELSRFLHPFLSFPLLLPPSHPLSFFLFSLPPCFLPSLFFKTLPKSCFPFYFPRKAVFAPTPQIAGMVLIWHFTFCFAWS